MRLIRRLFHRGPGPVDWRVDRRFEWLWDEEPPWLRSPRHVRVVT